MAKASSPYLKAQRHLARQDPILQKLIAVIGRCTLEPHPGHFEILVRSIISQQISAKAAVAIFGRLAAAAGRRGVTPRGILALADDALRSAGLSSSKARSLRDLAEKVQAGLVPLADL